MAYSEVPTQAEGNEWSSADHNTYIKDNLADHETRLLTREGFPPGACVTRGTTDSDQTISGTADLQFINEIMDTDGYVDLGVDNTKITIPADMGGKYLIYLHLFVVVGNSAYCTAEVQANSSEIVTGHQGIPSTAGYDVSVATVETLSASDEITISVYTSASRDISTAQLLCYRLST